MDYGPRAILAALRAGLLDRVLQSNTVWLCASCYSCTVRCPAGIRFTDVMYELKRFGLERGLHRQGVRNAAMARAFVQGVDERGRSAEMPLLIRYILRAHRSAALSFLPLGWRLLRRGRIDFHPRGISQVEGLRRMMDAVGKEEAR
jgi:heterodisulfide reductase subunit C